jgi:hypothetical protein
MIRPVVLPTKALARRIARRANPLRDLPSLAGCIVCALFDVTKIVSDR